MLDVEKVLAHTCWLDDSMQVSVGFPAGLRLFECVIIQLAYESVVSSGFYQVLSWQLQYNSALFLLLYVPVLRSCRSGEHLIKATYLRTLEPSQTSAL